MKLRIPRLIFRSALILACAVFYSSAQAGEPQQGGSLYACTPDGDYFVIDHTDGSVTPIGLLPENPFLDCGLRLSLPGDGRAPAGKSFSEATEIEYDFISGRAFLQFPNGSFTMQQYNVFTGAGIGKAFCDDASMVGLEFINGVLFGAGIGGPSQGQPSPNGLFGSLLYIIDVDMQFVIPIGPTGYDRIPGLAYDEVNGILYGSAISGGQQPAGGSGTDLVTIDRMTGQATFVGSTGVSHLGSIEFGPDGNLYGVSNFDDGGNFYEIDTTTGQATLIASTGYPGCSGLTLGPTFAPPQQRFILGHFNGPLRNMTVFFEDHQPDPSTRSYLIEVRTVAPPQTLLFSRIINILNPNVLLSPPFIGQMAFLLPLNDPMDVRSYEQDYQHRVRVYNAFNAGGTQLARSDFDYVRMPSSDLKSVPATLGTVPPVMTGMHNFQFTDSRPTGSDAYYKYDVSSQTTTVPAIVTLHATFGHTLVGQVTTVHPPAVQNTVVPINPGLQVLYAQPKRSFFKTDGTFIIRNLIGTKTVNLYVNGTP